MALILYKYRLFIYFFRIIKFSPKMHLEKIQDKIKLDYKMGHLDLNLGSQTHQKVPCNHYFKVWNTKSSSMQGASWEGTGYVCKMGHLDIVGGSLASRTCQTLTCYYDYSWWMKQGLSDLHPSCIFGIYRTSLPNGSPWPSLGGSGATNISGIALVSW